MDQEGENRVPLSASEAVERYGWPSEFLGAVSRAGGPGCKRVMARCALWRGSVEQAQDTRAVLSLAEGGDAAERALAAVERAIEDQERYARQDTQATGVVDPARQQRIDGLRSRRDFLRSLTRDRCPPPLI